MESETFLRSNARCFHGVLEVMLCPFSTSNLSTLQRCGRCHNFVVRFSWKAPSMNQVRKAASQSFPRCRGETARHKIPWKMTAGTGNVFSTFFMRNEQSSQNCSQWVRGGLQKPGVHGRSLHAAIAPRPLSQTSELPSCCHSFNKTTKKEVPKQSNVTSQDLRSIL